MLLQKIHPQFASPFVVNGAILRPLVHERLERSSDFLLTLIVAPPGFGKTTALGIWLDTKPESTAYLAIGPRDAEFPRFGSRIVAILEAIAPGSGDILLRAAGEEPVLDGPTLAELTASILGTVPHDVTLVVDDYHEVVSADIHAFFGELIRLGVPSIHVVLASRYDPSFPWARLRLDGRLQEIRWHDLKLTEEQAAIVLGQAASLDQEIQVPIVQAAWHQTQGWPAGIQSAALALARLPASHSAGTVISDEVFAYLNDFLIQEVFVRQPKTVRDALMYLSVLERFDSELATALLAQSEESQAGRLMLEELISAGPYLEHDAQTGWVRFHPLFRNFLLKQLATHHGRWDRQAFQQSAGEALAARGYYDDAIRLLVEADRAHVAADLVERHMAIVLSRQDWRSLDRWLKLLPQEIVPDRPWLLIGRIWISHLSGRDVLRDEYIARLRSLVADRHTDASEMLGFCDIWSPERVTDPEEDVCRLRRAVAAIPETNRFGHGLSRFYLGMALQAAGRAKEALSGLEQWTQRCAEEVDAALVLGLQGQVFVHLAEGNLIAAEMVAREMRTLARRHDLPVAAGWAERGLGTAAYLQNRLEDAERHFAAMIADGDRANLACVADSGAGLVCALWEQGREADALAALDRTLTFARDHQVFEHLAWARTTRAAIALRQERPDVSGALGLTEEITQDIGYLIQFHFPQMIRIRALLYSGTTPHLREAEQHLNEFEERAERHHHLPMQVSGAILRASLYHQQGNGAAALATLGTAIARGAPERIIRPFLDVLPLIQPLLLDLVARRDEVVGMDILADALGPEFHIEYPRGVSPSLQLLTMREAEVFGLLLDRLTYKEIAYQLSISPDTVKRHVNSIYTKLDVASRREALLKAVELGWHPE